MSVLCTDPQDRSDDDLALLMDATKSNPFFARVPHFVHKAFCHVMTFEGHLQGDVIYTEGSEEHAFFILRSGYIEAMKDGCVVAELRSGEMFGFES